MRHSPDQVAAHPGGKRMVIAQGEMQKFLVADQIGGAQEQPISVVTHWLVIAKRK